MDNDKDKPHKNNKMASFFQLTLMGEISKLENKVILFVLEIIFFFIIALLTGLAISYPIFKFGTLPETSGLYKVVVSLGLVILVMAMYIYRFIKSLMEERLRHAESDQRDKMLILHIIHSYHKLFPRWINVFSQTIYYISKRLLRGTFILIGFYLIATTGQLVSEKTLSLSSGGELSWYVPATLLFILLLLLGIGLIFQVRETLQIIRKDGNDIFTYILLPFRALTKYFIDMFEMFIILMLWIILGIDYIMKLSKTLYVFIISPISPFSMIELPLWVYLLLFIFELITITLIFEAGRFIGQTSGFLFRKWFIFLSGAQLVIFYFGFFAYLIYNILS